MSSNRLMYQDWIVSLGYDPAQMIDLTSLVDSRSAFESIEKLKEELALVDSEGSKLADSETRRERVIEAVHRALSELEEDEREFVLLHHFMGCSFRQIATRSGRAVHKLESLNHRAIRKLKRSLADFVRLEFGLAEIERDPCPICESEDVDQINRLLSAKTESETWREYIRLLADQFGLEIRSPQTLIGHCKFH